MSLIPIYIINLPQETERKKNLESQFKKYNFTNYKFIEGIYGSSLTQEEKNKVYNKKVAKRINRPLLDKEIGVALSHQKCYQTIIDNNNPYAIILENDIKITKEFINFVNNFDPSLDYDFGFLLLGYFSSNVRNSFSKQQSYPYEILYKGINNVGVECFVYLKNNKILLNNYPFYEFDPHSYQMDFLHGSHAYLISNKTAHLFKKINSKVKVESDNMWNYFDKYFDFKFYGAFPTLVNLNPLNYYSELEKERKKKLSELNQKEQFNSDLTKRMSSPTFGT